MFHFQGWIYISVAEDEQSDDFFSPNRAIHQRIRVIRNRIVELRLRNDVELMVPSAAEMLSVNAIGEHEPGLMVRLRTLADEIGQVAVGPCGAIFFRHAEFAGARFQRLDMLRGVVAVVDDDLASLVMQKNRRCLSPWRTSHNLNSGGR